MKGFLVSLLIFFALALCGLCIFQWHRETDLQDRVIDLMDMVYLRDKDIQGFTNSIRTMDHQIAQMDLKINGLIKTNKQQDDAIFELRRENNRAYATNDMLYKYVDQYSNAVLTLRSNLTMAYDNIKRQNQSIKGLEEERNDYFKKLNESIRNSNTIVSNYNELAGQFEKLRDQYENLVTNLNKQAKSPGSK